MISMITPALVKDEQGIQWLHEAIASVHDQTVSDWEMVIVDDHSPVDLSPLKAAWPNVRWLEAEGQGVSAARNQAAKAAQGNFLLPLDADDKLVPTALEKFRTAWPGKGIVYSDVVMFGQDYSRVYLAPDYDFIKLLTATYMTVGCLHRKADWERVGGWRQDMTQGLEDWEYWIALGEAGVCGTHIAEPLYWYRRHPRGRLQWLKANKELWAAAYYKMRELHRDSYNGRYPMGCCGGKAAKSAGTAKVMAAKVALPQTDDGLIKMVYTGPKKGDFHITAMVSRTKYRVPGQGQLLVVDRTGIQGVYPQDVPWLRSAAGGRDFQIVEQPKPAPALAASPVPVVAVANSEAWEPNIMEDKADVPKPRRTTRRTHTG